MKAYEIKQNAINAQYEQAKKDMLSRVIESCEAADRAKEMRENIQKKCSVERPSEEELKKVIEDYLKAEKKGVFRPESGYVPPIVSAIFEGINSSESKDGDTDNKN